MKKRTNIKALISFFIILTIVLSEENWQCTEESFLKYSSDPQNNCEIKNDKDRINKFEVFCSKLKSMRQQNQKGEWTASLNNFGCLSEEAISNNNGLVSLTRPERPKLAFTHVRMNLPDSLDLRGQVSSIKSQGSCGSCWAFAAAACAEAWLIRDGQFGRNLDLSQQYLVQCTPYSDCSGGYIEYAMNVTVKHGLPREQVYPYRPQQSHEGICEYRGMLSGRRNLDFYDLTAEQVKEMLLTYGPVVVSISSSGWSQYSSGVFKCDPDKPVDHAVLAVGWTHNAWIIKNQWGSRWGEGGYIYISMQPDFNCKIGQSVHAIWQPFYAFLPCLLIALLLI